MIRFTFMALATLCALNVFGKAKKNELMDRIGVCNLPSSAKYVKDAGGHHIEIGISGFLVPEKSDADFIANKETAQKCELPVESGNGFFPSDIILIGPTADVDRAIRYTEVAMRRASEIGLKTAVLGSGRSRNIPEGFPREKAVEQFMELLRRIGSIARKYGVTIVIEPLNSSECNFINSVQEGYEIVKAVKHPNIGVLADFYHMAVENESPQSIIKAGRKYLRHVHIAEKAHRTAPGVEGDDFTPYFRALKKIKYKGTMSLECGWNNFANEVEPAIQEVKKQLNQVYHTK